MIKQTTSFYEEIIAAGFGGQGIILIGKLIAQAAMDNDLEITYMPSYGVEVRGGTSNCKVILSSDPIACPLIESPNCLIAMNKASYDRFLPTIKPHGRIIINTSRISDSPDRKDITVHAVPADDIARSLGQPQCANMAALGAYAASQSILTIEQLVDCLPAVLAKRYHHMLDLNTKAIHAGAEHAG